MTSIDLWQNKNSWLLSIQDKKVKSKSCRNRCIFVISEYFKFAIILVQITNLVSSHLNEKSSGSRYLSYYYCILQTVTDLGGDIPDKGYVYGIKLISDLIQNNVTSLRSYFWTMKCLPNILIFLKSNICQILWIE